MGWPDALQEIGNCLLGAHETGQEQALVKASFKEATSMKRDWQEEVVIWEAEIPFPESDKFPG